MCCFYDGLFAGCGGSAVVSSCIQIRMETHEREEMGDVFCALYYDRGWVGTADAHCCRGDRSVVDGCIFPRTLLYCKIRLEEEHLVCIGELL